MVRRPYVISTLNLQSNFDLSSMKDFKFPSASWCSL